MNSEKPQPSLVPGSGTSTAVNSSDLPRAPNGHASHPGGTPGRSTSVADVMAHDKIPGLTLRTFFMAILVAMGGFIFGYDTGQISGFLEMKVFLERFGEKNADGTSSFSNVRSGLIVGILSIGTLIGALIAGPLANKFGRKWCIPWWSLIFIVGVIVQIAVGYGDWVGIAMGRWTAGLGVGALSVLVPLYMTESSPMHVRGAVVACYQLFITIGIWTADCINFGTESLSITASYRIPMAIGFLWPLILGVGILFLPETPRHDWNHNRSDRALLTMSKFYGVPTTHPVLIQETAEIEKVRQSVQNSDHPWHEALTAPRMFHRIALAMLMQTFQQLTGANYFFYYGTSIFEGVGINNSYTTAIILGSVNVGATFVGVWMARRFPRRQSLYYAALFQTICFLIFASVGQFLFHPAAEGSSIQKTAGTVMIVFSCLFIFSFATTWGPLVWACIGEMFPYRYRAVGMAFATSANWFWNFMLAFFTPFITGDIQFSYGYVFAGCNLAAAVLVYFFLIESSGRTLEEVDSMYLLHVSPITSQKFRFEGVDAGDIGTDQMHLKGRGWQRRKSGEAGREGFFQEENVGVGRGEGSRV